MGTSHVHSGSQASQPASYLIASRFSDPVDCLTAHLILECSATLAGVKPASLVSLANRQRPCGRNLHLLWQRYNTQVAASVPSLHFKVLQCTSRSTLLCCYHPEHLHQYLSHPGIRALLGKAGYDQTLDSIQLLDELGRRVESGNGSFPHEVGLFIGYPAKDVAAFMGMVKLPFTCQGPWKIFGKPEASLRLARSVRTSRTMVCTLLEQCATPRDCLVQLSGTSARPAIDKNYQTHIQEA